MSQYDLDEQIKGEIKDQVDRLNTEVFKKTDGRWWIDWQFHPSADLEAQLDSESRLNDHFDRAIKIKMRKRFDNKSRGLKRKLIERDGEHCASCEKSESLVIDHVVSISRGGTNDIENLQLLCNTCNEKKGAK
jgi:5-methylcytosine-specific restriction endonuclease McrA